MGRYFYSLRGSKVTSSGTFHPLSILHLDDGPVDAGILGYCCKEDRGHSIYGEGRSESDKAVARAEGRVDHLWGDQRPEYAIAVGGGVGGQKFERPQAGDEVIRWGEGWSVIVDDPDWQGRQVGILVPSIAGDHTAGYFIGTEADLERCDRCEATSHVGIDQLWCWWSDPEQFGGWTDKLGTEEEWQDHLHEEMLRVDGRRYQKKLASPLGMTKAKLKVQLAEVEKVLRESHKLRDALTSIANSIELRPHLRGNGEFLDDIQAKAGKAAGLPGY